MSKLIRFAHLADLHLGGWREQELTSLNFETFKLAIQKVLDSKVDFCIFAGDIFNNAMPPIDLVEQVAKELLKLKKTNIPLYVIGGSHDYSNSGKSFLNLLETTGVFIDVAKWETENKGKISLQFTKDSKTKTMLAGVLGRKNGLDKNIYANLGTNELSKEHFNVFLFHTTLNDFKPDFMKVVQTPVTKSYLPQGFDYYAGGHVHTHMEGTYSSGILSYPGPLFPNNFTELKREVPSFNLCSFDFGTRKTTIKRIFLNTYQKEYVSLNIQEESPLDVKNKLLILLKEKELRGKIVLLELGGTVEGHLKDIDLSSIVSWVYEQGARHVLKNTFKLKSSLLNQTNFESSLHENAQEAEEHLIQEFTKKHKLSEDHQDLLKKLLNTNFEKQEGEKVAQHEGRVVKIIENIKS